MLTVIMTLQTRTERRDFAIFEAFFFAYFFVMSTAFEWECALRIR
jgi:hypothetical protein